MRLLIGSSFEVEGEVDFTKSTFGAVCQANRAWTSDDRKPS
jgi:hypothetical protein